VPPRSPARSAGTAGAATLAGGRKVSQIVKVGETLYRYTSRSLFFFLDGDTPDMFRPVSDPSANPSDVTKATRPRPAILRALGNSDPPAHVEVDGLRYDRVDIYKHDSWAATALYAAGTRQIICKFNRRQSFGLLPGAWVGRRLARREAHFLHRLVGIHGFPQLLGPVLVDGVKAENAVARAFISGHPLESRERTSDDFFDELGNLLAELHSRGIAYVDLHKRENVLVGDDGRPYLIDFQVSFDQATAPRLLSGLARRLFRSLRQMDEYHRRKLLLRCRPDQAEAGAVNLAASRPRLVRWHRVFAEPLRRVRRKLLTLIRVRRDKGRAESEVFAEAALRPPKPASDAARTRAA
jgi:predicted Ser/Thr protein kinase